MFRLWGKIFKNNDIVRDQVFETTDMSLSLEDKVKQAIEELCYDFDISKPMWFSDNHKDFDMIGKTKFRDHHFIDSINFDYFEIEIIENKDY